MAGRQAKVLSSDHLNDLLLFADCTRNPLRNRLIVLLSAKAGLRAGEIANLTWDMVTDGNGRVGTIIELRDCAAKTIGLTGCSSHSGRRTFVTRAARLVHNAVGSLRDVQLLAGHRSIQTTQRYIDGDTDAQRKLVAMI
jgi:integrase/recombinase XerD